VNECLTNDLGRIAPGQAQYTLCCDEDGGVVDDLIVYLHDPDDVLLVPNAANTGTPTSPSSPSRGRSRCRCWGCSVCPASWTTCPS
jgi:hypothetical protein